MPQDNLTAKQNDYAIFLPAISNYYATFVGKQRSAEVVKSDRIPFVNGMEAINFLNADQGLFTYKWGLYSAGHAKLDISKPYPSEAMLRERDRANTLLVGDSGGFQIGKGVWEGNWSDPDCPKAAAKRKEVLEWLDAEMDYGMILDIPSWVVRRSETMKKIGITTYQGAVNGTRINNDYFMANRKGIENGGCKFLNVLQGETHNEADDWYKQMKDYCDPKEYPTTHFDGWAMGGQNMCDLHLILNRMVDLHHDHLLEKGVHDWMHFLGTSKLEWALLLTDIQRTARRHYNPNLTISFDCAGPFIAAANGLIYHETVFPEMGKWIYRMAPSLDNKRFYQDTRPFAEVIREEKYPRFKNSPISEHMAIKDICCQGPTCLNKLGKLSKSSYDAFSYALLQIHNVWIHINAVQEANRLYDKGRMPKMLVQDGYHRALFRDIVEDIFSTKDPKKAKAIITKHDKFWQQIVGTRGQTGKRSWNAHSQYNVLFSPIEKPKKEEEDQQEFCTEDETALDKLEKSMED